MEQTLIVLNRMCSEHVIADYAIGGAVAALFYMEPVLTYDLDVFIRTTEAGGLDELGPVFDWLKRQGYPMEGEHVVIAGLPVQFLPATTELLAEALAAAREHPFKGTVARVIEPEHLAVIMLQTGRPKDRERLAKLMGEAELDPKKLEQIAGRFGLIEALAAVTRRG